MFCCLCPLPLLHHCDFCILGRSHADLSITAFRVALRATTYLLSDRMANGEHDDGATSHAQAFNPNWSASDVTGLLPTSVPLKHIPRAWERKPSSPFTRRPGSSKVWRRVQMPNFNTRSRNSMNDEEECAEARKGGTIQSPKKVVKKLCLNNGFGQDWKVADWERRRGSHSRASVH